VKFVKLWVPVIVWAGIIFILSGIPYLKSELEYDLLIRKLGHITEYFILTLLLYRAFKGSFNMNASGLFIYPANISLFYAVSDEVHQYFVLGRDCSVRDVLIDTIGIICFYVLLKLKRGVYVR
jgi:VanZ family protein